MELHKRLMREVSFILRNKCVIFLKTISNFLLALLLNVNIVSDVLVRSTYKAAKQDPQLLLVEINVNNY